MPAKKKKKGDKKKQARRDDGPVAPDAFENVLKHARASLRASGVRDQNELNHHVVINYLKGLNSGIEEEGMADPTTMVFDEITDAIGIRALCQGIAQTGYKKLLSLCLWNCGFGDLGAACVSSAIEYMPSISKLEMLDCGIGPEGCMAIGTMMKPQVGVPDANIVILRLTHNPIGSEGMAYLAEGLVENNKLRTLSLDFCSIDHHGGAVLGRLLQSRTSNITDLNLEGNELLPPGVVDLARGLRRNKTLTKLDLSNNSCGGDIKAISALSRAFRKATTLTDINLDGNLIGNDGCKFFVEFLHESHHILEFRITPFVKSVHFNLLQDWLDGNYEFQKQLRLKKKGEEKKSKKKRGKKKKGR